MIRHTHKKIPHAKHHTSYFVKTFHFSPLMKVWQLAGEHSALQETQPFRNSMLPQQKQTRMSMTRQESDNQDLLLH